ncbi:3',5'-cyclic adenosine monophosphate phosphodiesterase CpdA [Legionella busanensis]|uniref:3',5'-cyclic adenosine monophosphate phosphodiesterase CpdA n=1 Tax=Legionella busanensis TaxID=190655 RepID=A0A378JM27_9GAMM|nr:metallophosphoesterase [Legionella busanensis]STX52396.1 3',5'-cyclic adenosine monophosphate phosphodiesterase CpdA [Legionella busanensis]
MNNRFLTKTNLKLLQITDLHLFASNDKRIFGIDSNNRFKQVITHIKQHELHDTDAIILTGDLSQDETRESYQHILMAFKEFKIPVYWIPGNHDNLLLMQSVFASSSILQYKRVLNCKYWHFIFLNTAIPSQGVGYLNEEELFIITEEIKKLEEPKKIALIMHHHPAYINTPLMDQYGLKNQSQFWQKLINSPVQLIICGHVHGHYSFEYQNITIECAPATCFQIKKGAIDLKIENLIGYKCHIFKDKTYQSVPVLWAAN